MSGATILVVEDEPALLRLAVQLIARAGFQTLEALDGDAALAQLDANPDAMDVAFIDLGIPPRGGAALLREMLDRGSNFGIVLTSGGACTPELSELLDQHGGSFLQKPFSASQLVEALETAADRAAK